MERPKTCSRIEIEIYFHEKGYDPEASHYQLKYLPHDLDFYIPDSFKQGGFVGRYAFKIQDRKTLDEVIDLLEEKIREAYEENISIGIVSQNHDRSDPNGWRNSYATLAYFNGRCAMYNRQINEEEMRKIYITLNERLDDIHSKK